MRSGRPNSFGSLVMCCLVLVVCFGALAEARKKHCLLHAERGILVEDNVEQPSGLTFSHRTKRLYMICDTGHCNYIFEFDEEGEYIRKLEFTKDHKDVEAVACYDKEGLLYIGEESKRKVTAYYLPSDEEEIPYSSDSESSEEGEEGEGERLLTSVTGREISVVTGDKTEREIEKKTVELVEAFHFTVAAPEDSTLNNGLEGLTVNDRTGEIFCTNEKEPREIIRLSQLGEPIDIRYPAYAKDLSGLCYDNDLDLLWVLSDVSEAIYVTNVETGAVYDYWDLDMENPEGVALNNDHDPPLLYISTDPSSPQGAQYVAALFIFEKPTIGTGLGYQEKCDYDDNCVGCDEIKEEAKENQKAFDKAQEELEKEMEEEDKKKRESLGLLLGLPLAAVIVVAVLLLLSAVLVKRRHEFRRVFSCVKRSPTDFDGYELDDLGPLDADDADDNDDNDVWLEQSPGGPLPPDGDLCLGDAAVILTPGRPLDDDDDAALYA